ncbi:MAG: hypothetical protein J0L99_16805 [Chitinophagales bacterium]|nr:hypothetical protein [Chitinophagales bacterium]
MEPSTPRTTNPILCIFLNQENQDSTGEMPGVRAVSGLSGRTRLIGGTKWNFARAEISPEILTKTHKDTKEEIRQ